MSRFEALKEQLEALTAQQTTAQTKCQDLEKQLKEEQENYRRLAEEK